MRILVLNWRDISHPRAGGAEVRLHKIYSALVERGHEVRLISSTFPGSSCREELDGVEVIRVGGENSFWLHCLLHLSRWSKEYSPDVVVEDFNKLPLFSPLSCSAPRLIQMHHLWRFSIFYEASFPVAFAVWFFEQSIRVLYRREQFSVVSPSTKSELVSMGVGESQIETVYNGCDLSFYSPSRDVEPSRDYILWLGRLQKYKGLMDALKSFLPLSKKYPDLRLKIAGSGPFAAAAKGWVESAGLSDRVDFLGFVSEEEKRDLLRNAKLLLQTSRKEGWGLTVIEANACGTPVIANRAPGLCDSVVDGKNGLFYNFASVEDLCKKVEMVLDDSSLYSKLLEGSLERAAEFTWEAAVDETEAILKRLVEG